MDSSLWHSIWAEAPANRYAFSVRSHWPDVIWFCLTASTFVCLVLRIVTQRRKFMIFGALFFVTSLYWLCGPWQTRGMQKSSGFSSLQELALQPEEALVNCRLLPYSPAVFADLTGNPGYVKWRRAEWLDRKDSPPYTNTVRTSSMTFVQPPSNIQEIRAVYVAASGTLLMLDVFEFGGSFDSKMMLQEVSERFETPMMIMTGKGKFAVFGAVGKGFSSENMEDITAWMASIEKYAERQRMKKL
jgi:hypothetical protein